MHGCGNVDSSQAPQVTVEQRRAAINSAMTHLDANRVKEALAIISILAKKDPDSPQTQETYATVLLATSLQLDSEGDTAKGIEFREAALKAYIAACKHSTSPGLLQLSTAQLAQMLNKNEIATKYYELAHSSTPTDGRPAFFLTQMCLLNKEWKKAKQWASESLLRDPNEPFTLLSASLVEAELGNFPEAEKLATRGCQILPDEPTLRFMQARVIRLCGNPTHALEILSLLPPDMHASDIVIEEKSLCMEQLETTEQ
jgi:predicted Zn-dependent protease